ncbi:hypothetical protein ICNMLN_ICNMLN_08800, partial [Dysosmobacter welbionis]
LTGRRTIVAAIHRVFFQSQILRDPVAQETLI